MGGILGQHINAVAVLDFVVGGRGQSHHASGGIDVKRPGIGARQRIGNGVAVGINGQRRVDHGGGAGVFVD